MDNTLIKCSFSLMLAGHRIKAKGYKVKILSHKQLNKICLLIAYTSDTIYYLSAMEYMEHKLNAKIKYGTVSDTGTDLIMTEKLSLDYDAINDMLQAGTIFPISSSPGERKNGRLIDTDSDFTSWASKNGLRPYLRAYRSEIGADDIHYTTKF